MATLNDIKSNLKNKEVENPWEVVAGYESKPKYVDEDTNVTIIKKSISSITGVVLSGEINSQYITFIMDRFQDGIDLSDKIINICYKIKGTENGNSVKPINVFKNSNQIKFGWIIPFEITKQPCSIELGIFCIGKEYEEDYKWKSRIGSYTVEQGFICGQPITPSPQPDWFDNIMADINEIQQSSLSNKNNIENLKLEKLDIQQGVDNVGKVATVDEKGNLVMKTPTGDGSGIGITNYTVLTNKPKINGVELIGDKTGKELGLIEEPFVFNPVDFGFIWSDVTSNAQQGSYVQKTEDKEILIKKMLSSKQISFINQQNKTIRFESDRVNNQYGDYKIVWHDYFAHMYYELRIASDGYYLRWEKKYLPIANRGMPGIVQMSGNIFDGGYTVPISGQAGDGIIYAKDQITPIVTPYDESFTTPIALNNENKLVAKTINGSSEPYIFDPIQAGFVWSNITPSTRGQTISLTSENKSIFNLLKNKNAFILEENKNKNSLIKLEEWVSPIKTVYIFGSTRYRGYYLVLEVNDSTKGITLKYIPEMLTSNESVVGGGKSIKSYNRNEEDKPVYIDADNNFYVKDQTLKPYIFEPLKLNWVEDRVDIDESNQDIIDNLRNHPNIIQRVGPYDSSLFNRSTYTNLTYVTFFNQHTTSYTTYKIRKTVVERIYDLTTTIFPQATDTIGGVVKVYPYDESFTEPIAMNLEGKLVTKKQEIILDSSTPESVKKFRITVNDTGILKAEEIV